MRGSIVRRSPWLTGHRSRSRRLSRSRYRGTRRSARTGGMAERSGPPDGTTLAVIRTDEDTEEEKTRKEARDDAYVMGTQRKYAHLWLVDAASGAARQCGPDSLHVWTLNGYAWSPDG